MSSASGDYLFLLYNLFSLLPVFCQIDEIEPQWHEFFPDEVV